MTFEAFASHVAAHRSAVVLLEGTRALDPAHSKGLADTAERLARALPLARFRTGNAKGSDAAFAEGVLRVAPERLEYVLPHAQHRSRHRPPTSPAHAVTDSSYSTLEALATLTREASPQYGRFTSHSISDAAPPRPRAVARLLLRDTLKVAGSEHLDPPCAALFYVNPNDPHAGGTGHTLRVCERLGVLALTQLEWGRW